MQQKKITEQKNYKREGEEQNEKVNTINLRLIFI